MRRNPTEHVPADWIESLESRALYSVTISPTAVTAPEKVAKTFVFATFTTTDPAPLKTKNYTATIAFGDKSRAQAKVTLAGSTFTVLAGRNYKKQGFFTYSVVIKDKVDKSVTSATGTATIVSQTGAPFTDVSTNQSAVFKSAYGGTFSKSGLNYTNGTVTATRLADDQDVTWPLAGTIVSTRAVAALSAVDEELGYLPGATGGSYNLLYVVNGHNFAVSGSSGALDPGGPFRFAIASGGKIFTSDPHDNADGRDHLLTYAITGVAGQSPSQKTYLLFWEDSLSSVSDFDFNDMVIEVTTNAS